MTPAEALARLRAAGITLEWDGQHIQASPGHAITPTLAGLIRANREGLVGLLIDEQRLAEARRLSAELDDFFGRAWLRASGEILCDNPSSPAEWPPQGAYWGRSQGGPWQPIPGRIPLCQQFSPMLPYGCWEASQGRQCQGCRMAGPATSAGSA